MRLFWTEEKIREEAKKYSNAKEFRKNALGAYFAARRINILDEIGTHFVNLHRGSLGKGYTDDELQKEALKYETRTEFKKNSGGHYSAAWDKKILNEICQHMIPPKKWTKDLIFSESKKYMFRSDFKRNNMSAYKGAVKLKILDEVCNHMYRCEASSSFAEYELFNEIKKLYPNTKKMRDRSANIPNKPYIKGFDIDIFIPELNKGIEFDGVYWHSFETLRSMTSKIRWTDEDLKNYHQIKDDYFASKGIKLLHITDLEWLNNKEQSLSKIFAFLLENQQCQVPSSRGSRPARQ